MSEKNIFITGVKGVGKSTLINEWIENNKVEAYISGFKTLPVDDLGLGGFCMHSLLPIGDNDKLIGTRISATSCIAYTETFETLGVDSIEASIKDRRPIVLLDELGVLEKDALRFQASIMTLLNSSKYVIGVLKDKNHPFLEQIAKREDTLVLRLTEDNREAIKDQWIDRSKQLLEEVKK